MIRQCSGRSRPVGFAFSFAAVILTLVAFCPVAHSQTVRTWNSSGTSSVPWFTTSNWLPSGTFAGDAPNATVPGEGASTDIMAFATSGTGVTAGINMTTAAGLLSLGGIDFTRTSMNAFQIGNSSSTSSGTLQLNGATINSVANTLIRVNSGSLTITNVATGATDGGQALGLRLGITNGSFDVAGTRTLTISSVISEAASASGFTKTGTGSLVLGGANTFSGAVAVNAGLLRVTNSAALGTADGNTTVASGATLQMATASLSIAEPLNLTGNGSTGLNGALSFGGNQTGMAVTGAITLGGAALIKGDGNTGATLSGGIDLGANALTYTVDGGATHTISTVGISGSGGSLTKTGGGTLNINVDSTYTGATTISGGVLVLGSGSALGGNNPGVNGTVSISMAAGTTLRSRTTAGSTTDVFAPITLSGTGNVSFLVGGGAGSTVTTYNLHGAISGTTGSVVFSTGTSNFNNGTSLIVLRAASTYSGSTQISTGNGVNNPVFVRNGVANALPTITVLSFDQVAGGGTGRTFQYDLNGFDQTLAGLDNGGVVPSLRRMLVTSASAATLTISGSTNTQFGGADLNGSSTNRAQIQGAIALTKNGTGIFTLGGTLAGGATVGGNTFTGDTTVLGGILVLGETISIQNSAFDAGASIAGDGTNGLRAGIGGTGVTTLTLGGLKGANNFSSRFTTTNGGYGNLTGLTLNPGAGVSNSYSGDIGNGAGNLAFTKSGAGTQILAGVNTFTGGVTVSAGTLAMSGGGTLGVAPALTLAGGGLDLGATSQTVGEVSITSGAVSGDTIGNGSLTGTSYAASNTSGNAIVSANLLGPGSFSKTGSGTVTLSGTNTFQGGTTIDGGALRITNAQALGSAAAGVVVNGNTTGSAGNARLELSGGITVAGESATLRGNGNFLGALQSFSGTNEWAGAILVDAAGTRIGAANGAALTVSGVIDDGVNDHRLMYRVSDAAARVTLTGSNTYTGGSSIVGAGPVIVSSLNSVVGGSAGSNLGAPTTDENGRIFIGTTTVGGILRYVGTGETTDRTIQIGENGTIPAAGDTGGATIESSGPSGALVFSSGTFNVPTNAATGTSPTRTLTLGGTNAGANTISGVIQNNQITGSPTAAVNVTKTGAGSWTLSGANTYTGVTTIDGGTLAFSTVNQLLTGGLTLGGTAGSPIAGNLDLSAASATFGGAFVAQTDNSTAAASTITIGSGRSLALGNGMTVGFNSAANTVTNLNVVGSGTLSVNAGNFQLGGNTTTNAANAATLDMSVLSTFIYNVSGGTFRVGDATNSGGGGTGGSTLILADTSIITTAFFTTNNPGAQVQTIKLGQTANTINASSISIGTTNSAQTSRSSAAMDFNAATGTLTIRDTAGTGRASMTVVYGNSTTGQSPTGTVDLTGAGHSADLLLSNLQIAGRTATSGGGATGVFSFGNGTLDVTAVTIAVRGARTSAGVATTGTLNLGGGNVIIGTGGINLAQNSSAAAGDAVVSGMVNISGGTVVIGASSGTSITLGSNTDAANGGSAATLNITGGTTTLSGDIARGAAIGTVTSVLSLNGSNAVLDMGGRNMKNLTSITYTAGTLKNVGTVNTGLTLAGAGSRVFDQGVGISGTIQGAIAGSGVGLTKQGAGTLSLDGASTYSGATSITGGLLAVGAGGSINATSGIVVDGGGLRYNNATTTLTQPISFGAAGGSISGTGVIGTPLVFGAAAVLAPGNSPGTITGTAGVSWAPGGTYEWELNALSGTTGTNWDLLSVAAGGLDLADLTTSNRFTLKLITLTGSNTAGPLAVGYVPGDPYEFLIAGYDSLTVPGLFSTAANSDLTSLFTIDLAGWQGTQPALSDISVKVNADATGVVLVLVPEPATAIVAFIGLMMASSMVRRRRWTLR